MRRTAQSLEAMRSRASLPAEKGVPHACRSRLVALLARRPCCLWRSVEACGHGGGHLIARVELLACVLRERADRGWCTCIDDRGSAHPGAVVVRGRDSLP